MNLLCIIKSTALFPILSDFHTTDKVMVSGYSGGATGAEPILNGPDSNCSYNIAFQVLTLLFTPFVSLMGLTTGITHPNTDAFSILSGGLYSFHYNTLMPCYHYL